MQLSVKVNGERSGQRRRGRSLWDWRARRDMARSIAQSNPAPATLLSQHPNYLTPFVTFLFPIDRLAQALVTRIPGKLRN